ncbi:hypothetical protein Ae263Ps1_1499c [Pseudonocardia sp. Ae263_Ps1]|nr:hypothetical protein Ae150APs1_3824 [Pseudonocardia sp. Ae150A_Ps1]OLL84444.1 hypothetical protein Ae263Ps1_1499c [Pseudonocardia sp. Ae263_Ps1]OLL95536.1 hypothetical protein Ae356Ps1_5433 [Pseudonocardia sp. Ae356_Ps1]
MARGSRDRRRTGPVRGHAIPIANVRSRNTTPGADRPSPDHPRRDAGQRGSSITGRR